MIDYYTAKSLGGNTRKITIMLAETGLAHEVYFVDLDKSEQNDAWYLVINPNGKIPALIDHDAAGLTLAESGAILIYLAEKTGRFLPRTGSPRARVLEWLFWQASGLGPMAGQWSYFERNAPQPIDFAIARYREECTRLMRVLAAALEHNEFVAGDYSIADMMLYPWTGPVYRALIARDRTLEETLRAVPRWLETVRMRPAVELAMTRYEGSATRIARDVAAPLR